MKLATTVFNKKTGAQGHIFHLADAVLIPSKQYYARFKGDGGGFVGSFFKGSEITLSI